jgi:hypothetical protein
MQQIADIQSFYQEALELLVEKLRRDEYILAAFLLGSLSHDVVWEKSDIDMMLVGQEVQVTKHGTAPDSSFTLTEKGINIHAFVVPRSKFKRQMEGSLQSSFTHSLLTKGRLLYSHDDSIRHIYEASRGHLGARDRELQLLRAGSHVLPALTKAEKWFYAKHDLDYCLVWLMHVITGLAAIEVLQQGEITGREVIHQALAINPRFFHAVYTDLINGPKTTQTLGDSLKAIEQYLLDKVSLLYQPLLDYLSEAAGPRSTREICFHFQTHFNIECVDNACEWLADQGIIEKLSCPVRLTPKSKVDVEEVAYYYDGDNR